MNKDVSHTHTHTHTGVIFNLKKQGNPTICDDMDEAGGCYMTQNQPGTERRLPHDLTDVWSPRSSQKQRAAWWFRGWATEMGRYWSKCATFQ